MSKQNKNNILTGTTKNLIYDPKIPGGYCIKLQGTMLLPLSAETNAIKIIH